MRKIIYGFLILLFAVAVFIKAQMVKATMNKEAVILVSEYEKHGFPVDVFKVRKDNLIYYNKISGLFSNGEIFALVPPLVRSRLEEGQTFTTEYKGVERKGVVVSAGGMDVSSGLYRVVLRFTEKVQAKQDDIIAVNIKTSQTRKVTVVPNAVVYKDKDIDYVWKVKDNRLTKNKIIIGEYGDLFVEVVKGLEPSDLVLASSGKEFAENTAVRIHKIIGE